MTPDQLIGYLPADVVDTLTDHSLDDIIRAAYRRGYTAGYNARARAAQHWQDTHGAYRQHGQGENP